MLHIYMSPASKPSRSTWSLLFPLRVRLPWVRDVAYLRISKVSIYVSPPQGLVRYA